MSAPSFPIADETVNDFVQYLEATADKLAAFVDAEVEEGTKDSPVVISDDEENIDADLAFALEQTKLGVATSSNQEVVVKTEDGPVLSSEDAELLGKFSDHGAFQAVLNVTNLMYAHKVILEAAVKSKKTCTPLQYLFTKILPGLGTKPVRCFKRKDGERNVLYLKQAEGKPDLTYALLHINRKKSEMCACYQAEFGGFFATLSWIVEEYGSAESTSILIKKEE